MALPVCRRGEASSEQRAPDVLLLKAQKVTLPSQTRESRERLLLMQQPRGEEITVQHGQ